MKKLNILYWTTTGLFALFMASTSIPNIMVNADSIDLISTKMGYPPYIIPFLGVAKLLGAIGILAPLPRSIKEWAYAGLFFDLIGAMYSAIAIGGFDPQMLIMIVPFALMGLSYGAFHRKLESNV